MCCYIAPRGYEAHSGLASSSQRPEVLWLVTGSDVSKWGIPYSLTVLVRWESPALCAPLGQRILWLHRQRPHFHACVAVCRRQDRSGLPSPDHL